MFLTFLTRPLCENPEHSGMRGLLGLIDRLGCTIRLALVRRAAFVAPLVEEMLRKIDGVAWSLPSPRSVSAAKVELAVKSDTENCIREMNH
jgi:hypothetical protein